MSQAWCHRSLVPVLRTQKQVNLYEVEVSLVYRVSSRTSRGYIDNNDSKNLKYDRKVIEA